jgi:hypothetical protein
MIFHVCYTVGRKETVIRTDDPLYALAQLQLLPPNAYHVIIRVVRRPF